jgi:hypothetical protein
LAVDERKRFTWPAYATCLRARFECPALVLVVTVDQAVAHWASIVKIGAAARAGVATITDRDLYVPYNDVILAYLSEAARKALQMLPQGYQFQDPLIRESLEKGRDEGRVEGQREIVLRQLSKRFGPLPSWAEERITQATTEQVELYVDAVLTSASLEEVLQLNA